MKTILQIHQGLQNQIQNQLINTAGKKRNSRQIKSNINDILNDADNFENFEDTC
jgi:hypothetical protein